MKIGNERGEGRELGAAAKDVDVRSELGELGDGMLDESFFCQMEQGFVLPHPRAAPARQHISGEGALVPHARTVSRKRTMDSMPRWKLARWNFSLGACRLSSGRPKPISSTGS